MKTPVSESFSGKNGLQYRCFSVNLAIFLGTSSFQIVLLADPCSSITLIPLGLEVQNQIIKIITSITNSLSFVLELPKHVSKTIYERKNVLVNAYWNVKAKFELLSKSYIVFDNSSTTFKLLFVLLICMHVIVDSK